MDEPGTTLDDFDFVQPDVDVVAALTDLSAFLMGDSCVETSSMYIKSIAEQFPEVSD